MLWLFRTRGKVVDTLLSGVTDADVTSNYQQHNMLNAEQATKGCANHFQDAFSELYELQRRGMLCDITLFFESSREDSRQSTLDKDQQV